MEKGSDDIIIKTVTRLMVPLIQTMALYVYAHGHTSPGGGFQGGCIFAATFILLALAFGLDEARRRFKETICLLFVGLGVFIYTFTGIIPMFFGGEFLNYASLYRILHVDRVMARYYGIAIVELGVQLTVMASMTLIFYELLTGEKSEKRSK